MKFNGNNNTRDDRKKRVYVCKRGRQAVMTNQNIIVKIHMNLSQKMLKYD